MDWRIVLLSVGALGAVGLLYVAGRLMNDAARRKQRQINIAMTLLREANRPLEVLDVVERSEGALSAHAAYMALTAMEEAGEVVRREGPPRFIKGQAYKRFLYEPLRVM